jgi:hypothetical protein
MKQGKLDKANAECRYPELVRHLRQDLTIEAMERFNAWVITLADSQRQRMLLIADQWRRVSWFWSWP